MIPVQNIYYMLSYAFQVEYAAADGKLVLRFRLTDEGIEVAVDITK